MARTVDHFPDIPSLKAKQETDAGYRRFVGDGTAILRVPGLRELEAIRIGNHDFPLEHKEEHPKSHVDDGKMEEVTYTMAAAKYDEEGAYIVRSIKSNDGVWQDGQEVFVKGQFDSHQDSAQKNLPGAEQDPQNPQEPKVKPDRKANLLNPNE